MSSLFLDEYDFLSLSQAGSTTQTYTIRAGDQQRTQPDHAVLVFHKNSLKTIDWKDLGTTMQLVRVIKNLTPQLNQECDMSPAFVRAMYQVLTRYQGYDETSDTHYHYIPKLSGARLEAVLERFDAFGEWKGTKILDTHKGRFEVHLPEAQDHEYILAQFFALFLIYGKISKKAQVLTGLQVQIPVLHHQVVERLTSYIALLRSYGFVLTFHHHDQQQIATLSSSDPTLLAYTRILIGDQDDLIIVNKILEIQNQIFIHYGVIPLESHQKLQLYEVKR